VEIKKNIRRNLAFIIALTVMWVFLGSLINFHQHHISGKKLIDNTNPIIKPKDKKALNLQFHINPEKQQQKSYFLILMIVGFFFPANGLLLSWRKTIVPAFVLQLKKAEFPIFEKFRGPPVI
jgi:hypothetical protein